MSYEPRPFGWQGPEPPKMLKIGKVKTHFTIDGRHRYCNGRPAGKDRLERDWNLVDCWLCLEKRKLVGD